MFEIGFSEVVVIMVIALLVLGPERLPQLARTIGRWLGKARSVARSVKAEIDRELAAEELQRVLAKQAQSADPFEMIEKAVTPPDSSAPAQPSINDSTAHDGKS